MNASRRRKHRTAALMPDLPCSRRVLTVAASIGRRMAEGMTWLFRGSFRAVSSIALFAALLRLLSCRALSLPYRWLVTGSLLPDSLLLSLCRALGRLRCGRT